LKKQAFVLDCLNGKTNLFLILDMKKNYFDRRQFLHYLAGTAVAGIVGCNKYHKTINTTIPSDAYIKANTDWFAACTYGVGFHWTAKTVPRSGPAVTFQKAVEQFNLPSFVDTIAEMDADYVLLTCTHALQMLPAPNPVIESILPGRTCHRDLIQEMAVQLKKRGIDLILYYNHSCNQSDDPSWEQAVGYHDPDKNRLADNLCEIIAWMGQHYKNLIKAWWFDSPYSLDPSGPYSSVSTDMTNFRFPWERFTAAAKSGYAPRLVTYNAGVNETYLYTTHQDYWAGEMIDLNHPPTSRLQKNGLQWHGWTCLDDPAWVHTRLDTEIPNVLYPDEQVISLDAEIKKHQAPMTFNLGIYQDGTISPHAIKQMCTIQNAVKTG